MFNKEQSQLRILLSVYVHTHINQRSVLSVFFICSVLFFAIGDLMDFGALLLGWPARCWGYVNLQPAELGLQINCYALAGWGGNFRQFTTGARVRANHRRRSVRGWGSSPVELATVILLLGHRVRAGLSPLRRLWPLPREGTENRKKWRIWDQERWCLPIYRGHETEGEKEGDECICVGCWGGG